MKIEQPFSGDRAYCFEDLSIGECFVFEDHLKINTEVE